MTARRGVVPASRSLRTSAATCSLTALASGAPLIRIVSGICSPRVLSPVSDESLSALVPGECGPVHCLDHTVANHDLRRVDCVFLRRRYAQLSGASGTVDGQVWSACRSILSWFVRVS